MISTIAGLSERLRCMEDFVTYTLDNGRGGIRIAKVRTGSNLDNRCFLG